MSQVVVIGAGPAGLTAAWRLAQSGVDVQVVERAQVPGGHARTLQRDGWRHERGPSSFLGSAARLQALATDLGLAPVPARASAARRYVFLDGALQPLPANPLKFLSSPLLSPAAKLRLLAEPFAGKPRDDETVREFFEQRLGRAVSERLVDPLVSGIYAGDVASLGAQATFPDLFRLAREHGSLTGGAFASLRKKDKTPRVRGVFSFPGGMGDLTDALAEKLEGRLHCGADLSLRKRRGGWHVGDLKAEHVVLAAPAHAASALLADDVPALARELSALDYAPVVGVHLLFERKDVPHALDGFGFLIPRGEGLRTLGVIWCSSLFDTCGPEHVALTCIVGGAHDRGATGVDDEGLALEARRDLRRTLGINRAPADYAVVKHPRAIPQPGPRYLPWKTRVEALAAAQPGLWLTGNYLEGVALEGAVAHGEKTAAALLARLAA